MKRQSGRLPPDDPFQPNCTLPRIAHCKQGGHLGFYCNRCGHEQRKDRSKCGIEKGLCNTCYDKRMDFLPPTLVSLQHIVRPSEHVELPNPGYYPLAEGAINECPAVNHMKERNMEKK